MGVGNKKTYGNKGDHHNFQHRNLLLLGEVAAAVGGGGGGGTLATEATLLTVASTLASLLAENKLDFELKTVRDTVTGDLYQLRMLLDEETGLYTVDYIDSTGASVLLTNPVEFINVEALLTAIESELQTLNTTDFATAANQALAIAQLTSLNAIDFATETTQATLATEVTLAALLAAFGSTDFATETTLAALNATDFATEATASAAAGALVSLLAAFNGEDFATETTLAAFSSAFSATDFATETTLAALAAEDFSTAANQALILAQLTSLNGLDFATETTLAALSAKLNTLGQKASAASAPVVLSTEQEAILNAIETAITALSSSGLATEATLASVETLITTLDTVLDAIKLDTANLDVALSTVATETTLSSIETLITTLDTVLDNIKIDTAAIVANQGEVEGTDGAAHGASQKGVRALGTDGTNDQQILTDANGRLQVDVITGGGTVGAATEVTLSDLNSKFNTLGQKASALSAPVVLSTEQEAILDAIKTAVEALDLDADGLATELTLSAIETLVTSTNALLTTIDADTSQLDVALSTVATEVTVAAIETLLTTIDGVLDAIKVDTGALVVDLAAIEVLITTTNSLLTTIDGVLDAIKLDTANLDVALSTVATESTLTSVETELQSIDDRLTGSVRPLSFVRAVAAGSTVSGVQSVSLTFLGNGGTLGGGAVPSGFSISYSPNKGEDTVGSIAYTIPTTGPSAVLIAYVN